ncbi:MAG: molybdenum ABC transporter ATP-binding protein, partial [Cellvibrionaceae bacterium]|nr:molybdenum ABC transporter ATP-binding protein [Cellvibrionaceae bacterium]
PATLLLDEPTNGLDVRASFELLENLRGLCQQGVGLLLTTHHLQEIIPEIERLILLKNGELMADGPITEVLNSVNISELYEMPLQLEQRQGYYQVYPAD